MVTAPHTVLFRYGKISSHDSIRHLDSRTLKMRNCSHSSRTEKTSISSLRLACLSSPKKEKSFFIKFDCFLRRSDRHKLIRINLSAKKSLQQQLQSVDILLVKDRSISEEALCELEQVSEQLGIIMIDSPRLSSKISNRETLTHHLRKLLKTFSGETMYDVRVPATTLLREWPKDTVAIQKHLNDVEITFPLIMKPIDAHCHKLYAVTGPEGFNFPACSLESSYIAQEFIPHDAKLWKVCVIGSQVYTCLRHSLSNALISNAVSSSTDGGNRSRWEFGRISHSSGKYATSATTSDECAEGRPNKDLVNQLGEFLRRSLGLTFFNFDLIRYVEKEKKYIDENKDEQWVSSSDIWYVLDINYFPSFPDVPNRFELLCEALYEIKEYKTHTIKLKQKN